MIQFLNAELKGFLTKNKRKQEKDQWKFQLERVWM